MREALTWTAVGCVAGLLLTALASRMLPAPAAAEPPQHMTAWVADAPLPINRDALPGGRLCGRGSPPKQGSHTDAQNGDRSASTKTWPLSPAFSQRWVDITFDMRRNLPEGSVDDGQPVEFSMRFYVPDPGVDYFLRQKLPPAPWGPETQVRNESPQL